MIEITENGNVKYDNQPDVERELLANLKSGEYWGKLAQDSATIALEAKEAAERAAEQAMTDTPEGYADFVDSFAPSYSSSNTYSSGDYVLHDSKLYKANQDIDTPEAWTSAHWTFVRAMTEVSDLKDALSDVNECLDEVQNLTCTYDIVDISYNTIPKYLISNTGEFISINDARYVISDYIPVEEGHKYIITASANYNNCIFVWYDSNKDVVSAYNPGQSGGTVKEVISQEFTAPENSAYLVVASFDKSSEVKEKGGLVNILEKRVERLEHDLPEKSNTIRVSKDGDNISVKDLTSGNYVTSSLHGSNNGAFNFGGYYDTNSTLIKQASDDICPVYYDYSYRCGNHGNNVVRQATITAHGLTEADIGKVFTSSTLIPYVLVRIVDANTLWFIHNSSSHIFVTGSMATPVSDGSITLNVESSTLIQLIPSINNVKQYLTIDGTEITEDGILEGKEFVISETYGSIDVLEMLTMLKNNVGNNTNASYYSDTLPCDLIYTVNYKIRKSLQIIVEGKIVVLRDGINLTKWGITQSQMIKDGRRILVPYSTDSGLITINSGEVYSPLKWESEDFPPNKIYQFDTQSAIGFAVAYMMDYGNAEPEKRTENCIESAITISNANKLYPWVLNKTNNTLNIMTEIFGVAVRQLVNLDDTIVVMYVENNALYAEIEKRTSDDVEIDIPSEYNNCIIHVIHKSGTVYIPNTSTVNNKISVSGQGSLSIKII